VALKFTFCEFLSIDVLFRTGHIFGRPHIKCSFSFLSSTFYVVSLTVDDLFVFFMSDANLLNTFLLIILAVTGQVTPN